MKLNTLITFALSIAIAAGCSTSNITVKADETTNNKQKAVSEFEPNRQITSDYNLTFPISENPRLLGLHHRASMVHRLRLYIGDYRRVMGSYPDSLPAYIESGFPLFWQRNVMNGLPMEIITNHDVINDPSDYGVVKWEKHDDYHAKLISSNIDVKKYRENGEVSWVIDEDILEFIQIDDYRTLPYNELRTFMREKSGSDLESTTTVVGGTVPINMVPDSDTRMLYAQCGQLSNFFFSTTLNYYAVNNSLPSSFVDHLAFQQDLGRTPFLIKENFDKFAQELNKSNVEFRIGYDYSNTLSYTLLKINGETLISHCYKYDYNARVDPIIEDDSPGIHAGCRMAEIDMSSPMISDANLSALNIPDDFLVSIKDIPID